MWFEHLVELKRRTEPPPPLPEGQEAFVRGFSFYTDIRPPHHIAKVKVFGLPSTFGLGAMLPMFTLICLLSWTGSPMGELGVYVKWISVAFLVLLPLSMAYGYLWKGFRIRKRRWEFWEWPDFASFAIEEANGQMLGTMLFASAFILLLAFIGWVAR
jgi:hypothetical protein